ncbi:hypothetical protein BDZ91DRAFT_732829 [Kalaharituber pfeilii]|nr:hypothetical protein BDZ91DRAFT_732829 [Kalaharituber pfeilii]
MSYENLQIKGSRTIYPHLLMKNIFLFLLHFLLNLIYATGLGYISCFEAALIPEPHTRSRASSANLVLRKYLQEE